MAGWTKPPSLPEADNCFCARFDELTIDRGEPVDFVAFDIDGSDDSAFQESGHDHLRSRAAQRCQIARVAAHIVGDDCRSCTHSCAIQSPLDGECRKSWSGWSAPADDGDLSRADIVDADPAMLSVPANRLGDVASFYCAGRITGSDLTKFFGYFFAQRINPTPIWVSLTLS